MWWIKKYQSQHANHFNVHGGQHEWTNKRKYSIMLIIRYKGVTSALILIYMRYYISITCSHMIFNGPRALNERPVSLTALSPPLAKINRTIWIFWCWNKFLIYGAILTIEESLFSVCFNHLIILCRDSKCHKSFWRVKQVKQTQLSLHHKIPIKIIGKKIPIFVYSLVTLYIG